jgi:hypothetical protein
MWQVRLLTVLQAIWACQVMIGTVAGEHTAYVLFTISDVQNICLYVDWPETVICIRSARNAIMQLAYLRQQ